MDDLITNVSVVESSGVYYVSTKEIALKFKKRHSNVLQSTEKIIRDLPNDFTKLNFKPGDNIGKITNQGNRIEKEYFLTRDGFSIVAMGFTGKEALQWKVKYLNAFRKMEQKTIDLLQENNLIRNKIKNLEGKRVSTKLLPIYEEGLLGDQVHVGFQRVLTETMNERENLESTQRHMLSINRGLGDALEKISNKLSALIHSNESKAVKLLKGANQ